MPHYLQRKFVLLFFLISSVAAAQSPLVVRSDYGGMCPGGACGSSVKILDDGRYLVNSKLIARLEKADLVSLRHSLEVIDRSNLSLGSGPCYSALDGSDSRFQFFGKSEILELNTCGQQLNFRIDPLLTYQTIREKYETPWRQQEFARLKRTTDEAEANRLAVRIGEDQKDERDALTNRIPRLSSISPSVLVVTARGTSFGRDEFLVDCEVNDILKGEVPAASRNPNGTITISFKRELADAVMRQFQRSDWSPIQAIAFLKYESKWISMENQPGVIRMTDAVQKATRSAVSGTPKHSSTPSN